MKNNILIICHWGRNRSKYLADYLKTKGYNTDYAGIGDQADTKDRLTQEQIDWTDVIIVVQDYLGEKLSSSYNIKNKKVISLEVDDKTDDQNKPQLDGKEWMEYQQKNVYSKLKKEIDKFLPF